MTKQLAAVYLALGDFAEPLLKRLSGLEELEYLFYRHGWEITLDEETFGKINQALEVSEPLQRFLETVGSIRRRLEGQPESELTAQDILALGETAAPLFEALADFRLSDLTNLPEPLGTADFWKSVGEDSLNDLLEEYLRIYHSSVYLLLHFGGGIRYEIASPDGPFRIEYTKVVLDRAQILKLVTDPLGAIKKYYKWGEPGGALEYERLIQTLENVLGALGLPTSRFVPGLRAAAAETSSTVEFETDLESLRTIFLFGLLSSDQVVYEVGMEVSPALANGEATPSGLKLSPVLRGGAQGEVPLGESLRVKWQGGTDVGRSISLNIFPGAVNFDHEQPELGAAVEIAGTGSGPWYLLGNERTARIEVYKPSLRLSVEGSVDSPEVRLRLGSGAADGEPMARAVIPLDEADSFIKETVQTNALQVAFSPEVIWSTRTGLTFNGKPTLDIDTPVSLSLGPVRVQNLSLHLRPKQGGERAFEILAAVGLAIAIGPVKAAIDQVGFSFDLDFEPEKKNLGFIDLSLRFKPPTGLGLVVEAPGVVGGGFLGFKEQNEEYSGVLELQIAEKISVKAVCMLTTRMPDGGGYSLVALIFVEGFTPIQLGLGFVLTGIGGLIAINRTFDEEALRAGLKNHTLDSVMFPKDPVRNAPQILSNLNRVFPVSKDHYLFGPMVQIVWGTPTLITMNLGVVLELGARMRLLVLGQVSAILPKPELDLVRLRLDAVGVVDFDQGTASLDATLFDSRLLNRFVLTGDMAMRLRWESPRNFALAVGGLHPAFNPPSGFPKLKRIAINLAAGDNPRFRCEAYFAITSNTLQFGARADLYASAGNFNIQGEVGFDVLIQRDPFHFMADFRAQVQVKYKTNSLFKVRVEGALSGPRPLHLRGRATFEVFWWDISVRFDKTLVDGEKPPPPEPVEVLPKLIEALESPGNWVGALPDGRGQMVTLRVRRAGGNEVLLHPLGTLTVKQNVVPLDTPISLFGQAPPSGAYLFRLGGDLLGVQAGPALETVEDSFAPAQFLQLTDDEKLSRPSFEERPAGLSFGLKGFSFPAEKVKDEATGTEEVNWLEAEQLVYETFTIDPETGESSSDRNAPEAPEDPHQGQYVLGFGHFEKQYVYGAAGANDLGRSGRNKYRAKPRLYKLEREGWGVADQEGVLKERRRTYTDAHLEKLDEERRDPTSALNVVRPSELKRLSEVA